METDKIKEMLGERGKKQVLADMAVNKAVEFLVANAKEGKATAAKTTKAKAKKTEEVATEE